ncbi:hypothetical protein ILYODFUR_011014 [Ilyodon furcidens]|uniref:Uncharacterized protein n=1 Tax=Ilyodon furcidens TaxID=33524 RepID=A0ABV0SWB8_9TELE
MLSGNTLTYHYLAVQITLFTQDLIHQCAPTSALVSHLVFLPLLEESIHYSHFHPLCNVYHHVPFCIPVLDTIFSSPLFPAPTCPLRSAPIITNNTEHHTFHF